MKRKRKLNPTVVISVTLFIMLVGVIVLFFLYQMVTKEREAYDLEKIFVEEDLSSESVEEKEEEKDDLLYAGMEEKTLLGAGSDLYSENKTDVIKPFKISAVYLLPGKDFYKSDDDDFETIKKQIDESFEAIKELEFNTVVIGLNYENKVAYTSDRYDSISSDDILKYILSKTETENIYSYIVFEQKEAYNQKIEETIDEVKKIMGRYKIGGVIFDGYDIYNTKETYSSYVEKGQGIGFTNYMNLSTTSFIKNLSEEIKTYSASIELGILVEPIWALKSQNEKGVSATGKYEQLYDGHADTKSFVENDFVDFVLINNFYTTENDFETISKWWSDVSKNSNADFYMLHSNDDVTKWKDEKELANQVELLKEDTTYKGNIFSSLNIIIDENLNIKDSLLEAMDIKKEKVFIAKELEITNLTNFQFTTEEPNIIIRGSTDPKEPLMVNGHEVLRDEMGYFSYDTKLDVGENVYEFLHKEKTIKVAITKKVQIINAVSPLDNVFAQGGTQMIVSVTAYQDAHVTASLGESLIVLEKGVVSDGNAESTSEYITFNGVITLPEATNDVQNLGSIRINANWNGISESNVGGNVSVNKKIVSDIKEGKYVELLNTAETFSTSDTSNYSNPDCYPIPRGAVDRLASDLITFTAENGKTYSYYNLVSGNRVYASSVKEIETQREENHITGISLKNDGRYTYVTLSNTQKASYKMSIVDGYVRFAFIDTVSVPVDMKELTKNPMFSSATWDNSTLYLKLRGIMTGTTPFYEGNNLVLRFNNPLGAGNSVVVIDPGHSTVDPGALGFYPNLNERELNISVAEKVINKLSNNGVTVRVVPTKGATTLASRVIYGNNNNADLFVSIHHNASPNDTAKGTEAYYFSEQSRKLAANIANNISSKASFINRGDKFGYFYVTRHHNYPSVLVECGFVSTQEEYKELILDYKQEEISNAIVEGIISYLNDRAITTELGEEFVGNIGVEMDPEASFEEESSILEPSIASSSSSSSEPSSSSSSSESSSSSSSSEPSSSSSSSEPSSLSSSSSEKSSEIIFENADSGAEESVLSP